MIFVVCVILVCIVFMLMLLFVLVGGGLGRLICNCSGLSVLFSLLMLVLIVFL